MDAKVVSLQGKKRSFNKLESRLPFTIIAGLSTHESHTRDAAEISQSMSEERPDEQSQCGTVNVTVGSGSVTSQSSSAVAQSMVMTGGQLNIHPVHLPPSGLPTSPPPLLPHAS